MLYVSNTPRGYTTPASVSGAPPPFPLHKFCLVLHIVAEVVKTTADSKSIKGLQINKPVFQVMYGINL